mmetsp:Transcript_50401/g.126989  ORF Transcript_50401/g.126989 Transcript_50401/m.126989 type:complete len:172 (-) Transcript_50401:76-591(-)
MQLLGCCSYRYQQRLAGQVPRLVLGSTSAPRIGSSMCSVRGSVLPPQSALQYNIYSNPWSFVPWVLAHKSVAVGICRFAASTSGGALFLSRSSGRAEASLQMMRGPAPRSFSAFDVGVQLRLRSCLGLVRNAVIVDTSSQARQTVVTGLVLHTFTHDVASTCTARCRLAAV